MPVTDPERIAIATRTRNAIGQDQLLTPRQARAFVRAIQTTWEVETIQWSQNDSQETLGEAYRLVHAGGVLQSVAGGNQVDASLAFRRAGELFEWLARSNDSLAEVVPLALFAAGSYQLGGLPAMAAGLLRQVKSKDDGIVLFADFLSGDFDRVLERVAGFWNANPQATVPDASNAFFKEDVDSDLAWLTTLELIRSVGLAADSLRRGEAERLEAAMTHLRQVERFLMRLAPEDVATLAFFIRSACERYAKATIYQPLRRLAAARPGHLAYLDGFARRQYARGRGVLWQSQHQGIERLLQNSSFALCTPTGSGKTLVANLAIVKELLLTGDGLLAPLALYIVPSRALAGEVEAKLAGELGREFIVTGLYGGADWGITDAWLTADMPTVLIATVEKADALMRYLGPMLLARLKLLVVDEAHQVVVDDTVYSQESLAGHTSRAARLEAFISRLLARKPAVVRIALTAVAGGAADPVARWIEGDPAAEAVGSYYRSTRQAIGTFEVRPGAAPEILFDMLNDRVLAVRGRAANVYMRLRIAPMPQAPPTVRGSLNRNTQLAVLWTALHLTDGDRRILVSVSQSPEDTIKWYAEAFALKGWDTVPAFVPPAEGREAELFRSARMVCADYCGLDSHELKLLERGIATNHGQMPQRLRRMMVALIESSICRITVATATLTEGVNLPFDLIFLPSVMRSSFDPATRTRAEHPMSTGEFRNLAGRAGRPGAAKGMEGMILVALPVAESTTAPGQRQTQRDQINARRAEYDHLLGRLIADAAGGGEHHSPLAVLMRSIWQRALQLGLATPADFMNWLEATVPQVLSGEAGTASPSPTARLADSIDELDGIILSAIEELQAIDPTQLTQAQIEAVLTKVWQNTFARVASAYEDWMEVAFIQRGRGLVATVYPDAAERRVLYSFGYTPCIGRRFRPAAERLLDILHYADSYGSMQDDDRLALFRQMGDVIAADRGFGFAVRDTVIGRALYARWYEVLAWWMSATGASQPPVDDLRAWQTFVADNLEFRLGVAIGAVVAQRWTEENRDPFATPALDTWKETADLPWFAFWAKELLRWGTLDPFVAFALSQGIARSRDDATPLKQDFLDWMDDREEPVGGDEDLIDPRNFLKWSRGRRTSPTERVVARSLRASLSGTAGARGKYSVIPIRGADGLRWIDPAGFELAVSADSPTMLGSTMYGQDFELLTSEGPEIVRAF
ncbi:DEAD/DEAH box helicase [Rhizobium leguminosarum]|uniref:DEAD/DEAH box helicase n=1 Tax=Rhizobium leguminosarum TaxID=384 RepID=UPI003F9D8B79